jgi:hypothetical protein
VLYSEITLPAHSVDWVEGEFEFVGKHLAAMMMMMMNID